MNRYFFAFFFSLSQFFAVFAFSDENVKYPESSLEMQWERKEGTFVFKSWQQKHAFEIVLSSDQFAKIPKKIRKKFWYKEKKYFFSYHSQDWKEAPFYPALKQDSSLAKSRSFKDANPTYGMPLVELAHIIESGKVIFYTGAGISQAAGIPTMDQLEGLFNFDPQGKWIVDAVQTPGKVLEKVSFFSKLCFEKAPTKAHAALTAIALLHNLPIYTENVDRLHQKTGVDPVFASVENIQEKISLASLKELDAMVCIGLSKDAKGMLGWYKLYHPKGKIIAIDLNKPEYLGNEDIFIQADAQKLLPELHALFKNRVKIP